MARYHPHEALLVDYAAGTLPESLALMVATHLALCPSCRALVAELELLAGTMLEEEPPVALSSDLRDSVMACLEAPWTPAASLASARPTASAFRPAVPRGERAEEGGMIAFDGLPMLPAPLRPYVRPPGAQGWRRMGRGIAVYDLPLPSRDLSGRTQLLHLRGGTGIPAHTHPGEEIICVLAGGFSDAKGHYDQGDLVTFTDSDHHHPVADPDQDCWCLAHFGAPLRFTGLLGPVLNWLVH